MAQTYQRTVPSIFGADALDTMADIAKQAGKTKAFLVCDQGVMMSGGAERVSKAFESAGFEVKIYDDVKPDPTDEQIETATKVAKEFGTEVVVGVGGGSSMDTAKGVSVLMCNPSPISQYMLENENKPHSADVPVYLIPTAAGTGSETSPMCVVHELSSDTKKTVIRYADLAVLDPTMTFTCPASVTVNSGFDAFAHAVEALTTINYNPWSTTFCEDAIRIIVRNLETCVKEPENYEARAAMLYASNAAGDGLANMNVHIGHAFGHELGIQMHVPHGYACALAIPESIDFCAGKCDATIRKIGECIGIDIPEDAGSKEAASMVSNWIRDFMRKLGIQSLKERGIAREDVIALAKNAVDNCGFKDATPGGLDYDKMTDFCAKVYDNYQ